MKNWYAIRNKDAGEDTPTEMSIYDEIGMWGVTGADFIRDLRAIKSKVINLSINSPGGSVFDGFAIYNALRASGKEINVKVMGIAASIASVVMMAGTKRVMPKNAMVMVHNPWTGVAGDADELRETADVLDKIKASIIGIYVAATGRDEPDVRALLEGRGSYLTADEALANGFADEVIDEVKVSASYDLDRLPENVRAIFEGARNSAAEPPVVDEPPVVEPEPEPTVEPFANRMKAMLDAADLGDFAATWVTDATLPTTDEAVRAAIAQAREVAAVCAVAKQEPTVTAAFIRSRTPIEQVRAALCKALADGDEHIDTTPKEKGTATQHASPAAVTTQAIWAARKSQTPHH